MSKYYTPKKSSKYLFDPKNNYPFRVSRSKIDLFLNCARCFYLDRRLGVGQPPGFPFTLNSAVDALLKKEFNIHRAKGSQHPLLKQYGVDAIPVSHEKLNLWRDNFKGIEYHHKPTNLIISGAIDDLWQSTSGEHMVVDYKATAKTGEINLDADWQDGYKRQVEVYQWLLRANGLKVSNTAYFVYVNGQTDREAFDGRLEFDIHLLSYLGDDAWVDKAVIAIHKCLLSDDIPKTGEDCDYCAYRSAALEAEEKRPNVPIKVKNKRKSAAQAGLF